MNQIHAMRVFVRVSETACWHTIRALRQMISLRLARVMSHSMHCLRNRIL
jgi:hypothetical protein